LSFNKALEWQEKIEAEMASGGAGKIVLQDALTDFGFDAEKILNDLSPEEVGEALRDFFGYPKKSSENPEPTTTQS
jgi:hypothetical protein